MSQVNKSFLKFVTDFGPLAIFFFIIIIVIKIYHCYSSTYSCNINCINIVWFFEKKIPMMPLISGILITFFGGLTIYFNNPVFIYIKPTIINILFALALFFGKYFTKEPVLKKIMGKSIHYRYWWELLNKRWMYFFFGLAILNECVWRTQTEEFWVNFKVWGMLPITFIFTAFQISLINKHKINE